MKLVAVLFITSKKRGVQEPGFISNREFSMKIVGMYILLPKVVSGSQ